MIDLELEKKSGNVLNHVWEARALPLRYTINPRPIAIAKAKYLYELVL